MSCNNEYLLYAAKQQKYFLSLQWASYNLMVHNCNSSKIIAKKSTHNGFLNMIFSTAV